MLKQYGINVTFNDAYLLAQRLDSAGYVDYKRTRDNAYDTHIYLTSKGTKFLEGDSFSHKGTPVINNYITAGTGNVINTGNHATVFATITINKGDFAGLTAALRSRGVAAADIADLEGIIATEPVDPTPNRFGPKVNAWIGRMFIKALDGSWQIGVGAAGGVLTELLNNYFGIK